MTPRTGVDHVYTCPEAKEIRHDLGRQLLVAVKASAPPRGCGVLRMDVIDVRTAMGRTSGAAGYGKGGIDHSGQ
jgi:hypothetical protein